MEVLATNYIDNRSYFENDTGRVTPTELDILQRCRRDDSSAYEEIYYRYRACVLKIVSRMISIPADQEEVVQEVFFQVFRSVGSFRGAAKLSTWIQRVAKNVVHQHLRKKRSRIQLVTETDDNNSSVWDSSADRRDQDTPEDHAILQDRRIAVSRAMRTLSFKKKLAMFLYDFEGLSINEISQIVGAPVLTVRTRIFYARREFYKNLEKDPAF